MKKFTLLLSAVLLALSTNLWAEDATVLFHETFGDNATNSARVWNDTYKEQSGVAAVYQDAAYTITDAKQSKNTAGSVKSALMGTQDKDAAFIVGPLKVADYANLGVTYQWKAGSVKKTYYTKLYYSIDGTTYTEVTKSEGTGATTYVKCVYSLPAEAQSSNLYLKAVFKTSNTQAHIDEFELTGTSTAPAATLESIAISGTPNKTEYFADEEFNPAGLVVTGTYSDGSTKEITEGITWEYDPLTIETTSVYVIATVTGADGTEIVADIEVPVTVVAAKTLSSITVSGTPAEFWKGDTFNHNGMTVTANWDDNSTTDVTAEATFSEPDMTTAGEKTVTITYKEKTATYTIDVKTIANTQETAYTVAEAIDLIDAGKDLSAEVFVKGIVSEIVTPWGTNGYQNITYNISDDGTTASAQFQLFRCVTNGAVVGDKVIATGTLTKFNSTYELAAGNTIVAIETPEVTAIAISGEATKLNYFVGDAFNPAGLIVTATFADETTADVTARVEWTITPATFETQGTAIVTVKASLDGIESEEKTIEDIVVNAKPKTQVVTFVAGTDKSEEKSLSKGDITLTATTFNNTSYYQTYKSETFTASSTNGNIISIEFTCTTKGTAKYGPGCYTIPEEGVGEYTYTENDVIGTWTGSASSVSLVASSNQVRMTKIEVTYAPTVSTAIDNAAVETKAVKTIENGQLVIIREGVKYNAQGAVIR